MVHTTLIKITYLITDRDFDRLAYRVSRGVAHTSLIAIAYRGLDRDYNIDRLLDRDRLADADHNSCLISMIHALDKIVSLIAIALLIAIVFVPLTVIEAP